MALSDRTHVADRPRLPTISRLPPRRTFLVVLALLTLGLPVSFAVATAVQATVGLEGWATLLALVAGGISLVGSVVAFWFGFGVGVDAGVSSRST